MLVASYIDMTGIIGIHVVFNKCIFYTYIYTFVCVYIYTLWYLVSIFHLKNNKRLNYKNLIKIYRGIHCMENLEKIY